MQIVVYQFLIKQQCLMVLFVSIINGNQRILVLLERKVNIFQYQGNISNLFALGCFTEGVADDIAQFGTAINSSVKFLETYERGIDESYFTFYIYMTNIAYLS